MNDLSTAYQQLRAALTPLGNEIGRDELALWQDRERHGHNPLPAGALEHLADLAARLLMQEPP